MIVNAKHIERSLFIERLIPFVGSNRI
jgi:hypothetical protein